MLRDVFRTAGDYGIYGMISMVLFVVFFSALVAYALSLRKQDTDAFGRMPLEDQEQESVDIHDIKK